MRPSVRKTNILGEVTSKDPFARILKLAAKQNEGKSAKSSPKKKKQPVAKKGKKTVSKKTAPARKKNGKKNCQKNG